MKSEELEKFPKEKFNISLATARKVLKMKDITIGEADMKWLNRYMENRVRGESLPMSFWSNDILSELQRSYGPDSVTFLQKVKLDFRSQNGFSPE